MKDIELSLSVRYKDFEYTVKGDQSHIDKHEPIALNLLNKVINEEKQPIIPPATIARSANIIETIEVKKQTPVPTPIATNEEEKSPIQHFLETLPLQSEWQYTLAVAYFMTIQLQQPSFTAKSVRKQFREARHTVPNNIHLSVHTNVRKGFLKESGTEDLQKTYQLTDAGKGYLDHLKKISESKENNTINKQNELTEKQAQMLEFELSDYQLTHNPDPFMMERIEDQALSVLYIYRQLDYPHLSAQDVYIILRNRFSFKHSSKAVQIALSRSRPRVEKIKVDGQMHYQLTALGTEYLKKKLAQQLQQTD